MTRKPLAPERKRMWRPPGSKSKPKLSIVVLPNNEATMCTVILEVSAVSDVIVALSMFARHRGVGVSVLCGSGAVTDLVSRHHVHGPFEVVSFSGTVLLPSSQLGPPLFSVSLAGARGKVFTGRLVELMMMAVGGMVLTAAMFGSAQVEDGEGGRQVHHVPHTEDGEGGSGPGGPDRAEDQQQPMVMAVSIGGVGLGGGQE
jgi:predicted DNA-binding protein with PD1-like motif